MDLVLTGRKVDALQQVTRDLLGLAVRDLDTLGQCVQKPGVASTWVRSIFMLCDLWIVTG